MKTAPLSCTFFVLVIIGFGLGSTSAASEQVSSPLQYSGYSAPEYDHYTRFSDYVEMSDATKIAVDIYLPDEGPGDGPFPTLFMYYPYRRALANPATGEIQIGYTPGQDKLIIKFTSYGYAVVVADMRGSGASFGVKEIDMGPQLAKDGRELVEWVAGQNWCNGNIGMFGGSYHGWSQFAVAGQKPTALKAIMPEIMGFDMYSDGMFRPGGILNTGLIGLMAQVTKMMELGMYIPAAGFLPVAPVIDEDGDGDLADEIPVDTNGNFLFIDDGFPPTYTDGSHRTEHIYYNAVSEHVQNLNFGDWVPHAEYRDDYLGNTPYGYSELGPSDWPVNMAESGVAVYNVGGWFDIFTRGTTRWYATMNQYNPSKMIIHPSFHSIPDMDPYRAGPYWDYFGLDHEALASAFFNEKLRFFDRYLKGIENGIDKEPPVYIYVMNGEGWRSENEWPLARQIIKRYEFAEENKLVIANTTNGYDIYRADYANASRYGTNNGSRWIPGGGAAPDQVMVRTEHDKQSLFYTSEPLEQDTEITGHPIVNLWVSSTENYGDFFVYIEDVDENGEAYYVTEGMLRAGFAGLRPLEDILPPDAGLDVKPDLPFHGFRASDYMHDVLAGGNIVELVTDLLPTSWVFKKGHRIRVSITCADWPTFELNPYLSPNNDPADSDTVVPIITVYRDPDHPSGIQLPVVPRKPRRFEGITWVISNGKKYRGPASLYTYKNALYLHYGDEWIKWETSNYSEKRNIEIFKVENEQGKLCAFIRRRSDGSYTAKAMGRKIWFKGSAK